MSAETVSEGKACQGNLLESVDAETWLLNRLKEQGLDVYAHGVGNFPNLRDRLAQVIADNRFSPVLAGRHNGKPETYEQFVLRVFEIKLKRPAAEPRPHQTPPSVPRGSKAVAK